MILNKTVTASENEVSVKSYLCTSFNAPVFGIKANGFLEITNKRLLFQAVGMGATKNPSVIHSEIPISEVVGVSVYKGKSFDLFRMLVGLIIGILIAIIPGMISSWLLSSLRQSAVFYQFIVWVLFLGAVFYAYFYNKILKGNQDGVIPLDSKDESLKELALVFAGLGFLMPMVAMSSGYYNPMESSPVAGVLGAIALLYALARYSRKPAFSLLVFSKSTSNAIVRIAGPSPMGRGNSVASKALTASPAKDSMLVLKELGALILDIQNNGDFGIVKWTSPLTAQ